MLTEADLIRWSEALAGIARTGLGFTESLYERERYEEVLAVASEIRSRASDPHDAEHHISEWMKQVGSGVPGYATPKVAVGAIVGNDDGALLLIKRADSGVWLYPTGWADIGYSPAEIAVKEVHEETGIEAEVENFLGVLDGVRRGFTRFPAYSLLFQLRAIGGVLNAHPLECAGVGWFHRDELPEPLASGGEWIDHAYDALSDEKPPTLFDEPRNPPWLAEFTP
ncbi:MAG: NUDIX hydrolase N-terminal domain-containing protein [Acidobacteria bacterium]|nr:NUDIX hydrolase N-terminal domain-containing protein [Acidobacteriota bacterium]